MYGTVQGLVYILTQKTYLIQCNCNNCDVNFTVPFISGNSNSRTSRLVSILDSLAAVSILVIIFRRSSSLDRFPPTPSPPFWLDLRTAAASKYARIFSAHLYLVLIYTSTVINSKTLE